MPVHAWPAAVLKEKSFDFKLSGSEVFYTAKSLLVIGEKIVQ